MTEIMQQSDLREARERATRIRIGMVAYLTTLADIRSAWDRRDWQTLGYESWEAYLDGEFSEQRLRVPAQHREKAITELRMAGMSTRAIASATRLPKSSVARDIHQLSQEGQLDSSAPVLGRDLRQRPATMPERKQAAVGDVGGVSDATGGHGGSVDRQLNGTRSALASPVARDDLGSAAPANCGKTAAGSVEDASAPADGHGGSAADKATPAATGVGRSEPVPASAPEPVDTRLGVGVTPVEEFVANEPDRLVQGETEPDAGPLADERPKPPAWDPQERRQHEVEVRRRQDIEAARRSAKTIVTTVRSEVVTIVTGSRYGEKGLVTKQLITDLRTAIDLLEKEVDGEE